MAGNGSGAAAPRAGSAAAAGAAAPAAAAPHIAVIGGGVAGLTAARELARGGARVTLFEQQHTLGGRIRAVDLGGTAIDVGAEAFATRGGVVADFLAELGLAAEIVHPATSGAWVVGEAGALPLPAGGALGIPAFPLSSAARRHLGLFGALRAAAEALLPREQQLTETTTVADLVRRRLGERVLARLVRPIALGVYSIDPEQLRLSAVPGLRAAYLRTGSLVRAAGELRETAVAAGGAVASLAGGMTQLVDALAAEVTRLGAELRAGVRIAQLHPAAVEPGTVEPGTVEPGTVEPGTVAPGTVAPGAVAPGTVAPGRVEPWPVGAAAAARAAWAGAASQPATEAAPQGWLLRDDAGVPVLHCDAVLLAVPESVACELLGSAPPPQHAIEVIALALADARLDAAPRGTGALVAPQPGIAAKALTHVTAKWPDRAAKVGTGTHILRLSYGRAGSAPATATLSDGEALAFACRDATGILGLEVLPERVTAWARQPWSVGDPPGEALRLHAPAGLAFAGDWVSGTGIAAVIPGASAAAHTLLSHVSAHQESPVLPA